MAVMLCFLELDRSFLTASLQTVVKASFSFSLSFTLRKVHLRKPAALVLEFIPYEPRLPPPKLIPSSIIAIESPYNN